ncbi:MAG: hypothetical protein RLY69_577 [Verrucomicrobiota bacterium]
MIGWGVDVLSAMTFLDRLEKRLGFLAFPGLLRFYAIFHGMVYVLQLFRPDLGKLLEFDRDRIMAGEVWRAVSFLVASSGSIGSGPFGILVILFFVMVAFMMSDALEDAWGAFRTTLFHMTGFVGLILANLSFPSLMPESGTLIYGAAFFAFATLFPKVEFLVLFILPVQVRFLAWLNVGVWVLAVLRDLRLLPFLLLGYSGYLLFAGIPALRGKLQSSPGSLFSDALKRQKNASETAFHACAKCQRTDVSDPTLEFRVGADGSEYCTEHLPR